MRAAALLFLTAGAVLGQFKSTVPLVVAPTTVVDGKGRFVDGLTEKDLIVSDNGVPQTIQIDFESHPISLVVVIEASSSSAAILDKLGGSGLLFADCCPRKRARRRWSRSATAFAWCRTSRRIRAACPCGASDAGAGRRLRFDRRTGGSDAFAGSAATRRGGALF